ncbi:MAG: hypothetical protein OXH02_09810 [Gemmatimonadetes bacterium]|nr:hypothetical protein [Gemmatimonadota bacterium]
MHTAYTGNSHYCYSNSLHMCLQHAGMADLPEPGLLECMTGMPFGALFLQFETPLFFPSHADLNPNSGMSRALSILGWTCTQWEGENVESALEALKANLKNGPILLGPLDLGFLPYDPNHRLKRGGDHFIVALKLEDGRVQVHDPQFYPFAVLPVDDLLRAWNATDLGYATSAYTLRGDFREDLRVSIDDMLKATLENARELIHAAPSGPVFFGGSQAFRMAAEVIRGGPPKAFAGLLVQFVLPIGARRCLDAADFMKSADQAETAEWLVKKAESFGLAQYYTTQEDWNRAKGLFEALAEIEDRIVECI